MGSSPRRPGSPHRPRTGVSTARASIDPDLEQLYGVATKRLKEQVKRNSGRFPADFMFQLTHDEKAEVVATCDHLGSLKSSPSLPTAFTEHGAVMLAAVLQSPAAVAASIQVVRAFVRLRAMLVEPEEVVDTFRPGSPGSRKRSAAPLFREHELRGLLARGRRSLPQDFEQQDVLVLLDLLQGRSHLFPD